MQWSKTRYSIHDLCLTKKKSDQKNTCVPVPHEWFICGSLLLQEHSIVCIDGKQRHGIDRPKSIMTIRGSNNPASCASSLPCLKKRRWWLTLPPSARARVWVNCSCSSSLRSSGRSSTSPSPYLANFSGLNVVILQDKKRTVSQHEYHLRYEHCRADASVAAKLICEVDCYDIQWIRYLLQNKYPYSFYGRYHMIHLLINTLKSSSSSSSS